MRVAVDLHIHTALSACADNSMTPDNIVNMAVLKGLDVIAITDHNSTGNIEAVSRCAEKKNLLVIPGMEIETAEEVHLVCLFPGIREAQEAQELVYRSLPAIRLREDIFGEQQLYDENDRIKGFVAMLLSTATNLCVEDVYKAVDGLGGVVIPAHIDREANSMISNLGSIPSNLNIMYVEISKSCDTAGLLDKYPYLSAYKLLRSSDAHQLGQILERESFMEVTEKTVKALIKSFKLY